MSTEKLSFDPTPRQKEVEIGGKTYTIKEASGKVATMYRDHVMNSAVLGANGKPVRVTGLASAEVLLVANCLYDENDKLVPAEVVDGWPSRVKKALYDLARDLSDLTPDEGKDEDNEADAKN